ncbi:hypothetical protein SAMN05428951_11999 [Pseudomonas sp. OV546]|nr:hypothetical protein SAMN05428951_11999 [Pseudomonas sp. OV546]
MVAFPLLRSPGVVHPASIPTATAAIKIRMSFPLWFGGTVALGGRCKKPSTLSSFTNHMDVQ